MNYRIPPKFDEVVYSPPSSSDEDQALLRTRSPRHLATARSTRQSAVSSSSEEKEATILFDVEEDVRRERRKKPKVMRSQGMGGPTHEYSIHKVGPFLLFILDAFD